MTTQNFKELFYQLVKTNFLKALDKNQLKISGEVADSFLAVICNSLDQSLNETFSQLDSLKPQADPALFDDNSKL